MEVTTFFSKNKVQSISELKKKGEDNMSMLGPVSLGGSQSMMLVVHPKRKTSLGRRREKKR